jgi:WD40 repeat protein
VWELEGHADMVSAVAFSHDGSLLASASNDRTIRLWNPSTGEEVLKLEAVLSITTISFTMDNKTFLPNQGALSIDDRLIPDQAIKTLANETIMVKNGWIRRGESNLLWLPQEYRSGCLTSNGDTIAIGLNSDQVRFIQLNGS